MVLLESSGGISGLPPNQPSNPPTPLTPSNWEVAIDTPVRTLNDLKNVLIDHMGQEKGMQLYNFFVSSIVTSSIVQLQQANQSAQQAAKGMSDTDQ